MRASSKWFRTVLQLAAMVAALAGGYELLSATMPAPGTSPREGTAMSKPPDAETTGSLVRLAPASR